MHNSQIHKRSKQIRHRARRGAINWRNNNITVCGNNSTLKTALNSIDQTDRYKKMRFLSRSNINIVDVLNAAPLVQG